MQSAVSRGALQRQSNRSIRRCASRKQELNACHDPNRLILDGLVQALSSSKRAGCQHCWAAAAQGAQRQGMRATATRHQKRSNGIISQLPAKQQGQVAANRLMQAGIRALNRQFNLSATHHGGWCHAAVEHGKAQQQIVEPYVVRRIVVEEEHVQGCQHDALPAAQHAAAAHGVALAGGSGQRRIAWTVALHVPGSGSGTTTTAVQIILLCVMCTNPLVADAEARHYRNWV